MQPFRRMGQKVAMFVNSAALNGDIRPQGRQGFFKPRRAVDDNEFRRLQTARDGVVEQSSPSDFALATHVLDGEQNFLAVGARAGLANSDSSLSGFSGAPVETGKEQAVQVRCNEGVAIRIGPERCVGVREGDGEASVGERIGQPWSRESPQSRAPT